jgi:broad specificity phosphatase PhoE
MSQILLVRHGQASWGAVDYDVLSDLGERQAGVVGAALATRGVVPSVVLHGAMKRQRETARLLVEAAGWSAWDRLEEDAGWDEMDHRSVLERQPKTFQGDEPSAREFQAWFERATARWKSGEFDHEYAESFPAFTERVRNALDSLARRLDDSGTAVVVTSGGPIARITADLLGGDVHMHSLLAPVVVNVSVTKIVVGRRGTTLVSFNDHSHLETTGDGALLTYR